MLNGLLTDLEREFNSVGRFITENPVDLKEYEDKYVIVLNAAGFTKEDVEVKYNDGVLVLEGSMSKEENDEDAGKYLIRERKVVSRFSRKFSISNVKEDEISAKMENSVLTVTLPKVEKKEAKKIAIE